MVENQTRLIAYMKETYKLGVPTSISLLRSYTNDVYLIETETHKYVLKIYGLNWRTKEEILWEVDLLNFLSKNKVLVALPTQSKDGKWVHSIETALGKRYAVLFGYATGRKPRLAGDDRPIELELYQPFGECVARLHLVSDGFKSEHQRPKMDTAYLIDETLSLTEPLLKGDDKTFFADFTKNLKTSIEKYAADGLDWGPCHGDATFDNIHVTEDGQMVLYDFDSGGPCWRAAELQGWAIFNGGEAKAKQAEFLKGYQAVRPLNRVDIDAAPFLYEAFDVWGIKVDLKQRVLKKGSAVIDKYLSEQMKIFMERSAYLW